MKNGLYSILQGIMNEKGINIAEVARLCDLPDSTVRGIITRKQKSTALEVAFKLSKGLGVSLEKLNGISNTQEETINSTLSPDALEVVKAYEGADLKQKNNVRFLLELPILKDEFDLEKNMKTS